MLSIHWIGAVVFLVASFLLGTRCQEIWIWIKQRFTPNPENNTALPRNSAVLLHERLILEFGHEGGLRGFAITLNLGGVASFYIIHKGDANLVWITSLSLIMIGLNVAFILLMYRCRKAIRYLKLKLTNANRGYEQIVTPPKIKYLPSSETVWCVLHFLCLVIWVVLLPPVFYRFPGTYLYKFIARISNF